MIAQSVAFAEAALVGRLAFLDLGVANAKVLVYGTTRPPVEGDASGGPALCEFVLSKPAGTISGGLLELQAAAFALVMNSGSPVWARAINGNADFAFDCDAGVVGSGAEVELSTSPLYAGGRVALISAVLG